MSALLAIPVLTCISLRAGEPERGRLAAVREPLEKVSAAAGEADFGALLSLIRKAGNDNELGRDGLRLFYQGALIAVENACAGAGDDPGGDEPLRVAFLAGKYAGLAQRHLLLMESSELPHRGFGARLAAESVASYYYLGRLMQMEGEFEPIDRKTVYLVYFAASLRHWLGLDARRTAETAVVFRKWLIDLEKAEIPLSFNYLADLSTCPEMRDGRLPGDAPLFYKVSKSVENELLRITRPAPVAIIIYAAAETYAYPFRYRWLEPAGLALEKLKVAREGLIGVEKDRFLDNVREQLLQLRGDSKLQISPPEDAQPAAGPPAASGNHTPPSRQAWVDNR